MWGFDFNVIGNIRDWFREHTALTKQWRCEKCGCVTMQEWPFLSGHPKHTYHYCDCQIKAGAASRRLAIRPDW